jgi:hypothetical protein
MSRWWESYALVMASSTKVDFEEGLSMERIRRWTFENLNICFLLF